MRLQRNLTTKFISIVNHMLRFKNKTDRLKCCKKEFKDLREFTKIKSIDGIRSNCQLGKNSLN